MSERLITVVIPSYNYENYLPRAVESVAFQTYGPIGLVIVDDASRDNSPALMKEIKAKYESRFSGVKLLYNDRNMGAHAAINRGVNEARGELVAILNADDLYEPERFSVMAERMGNARLAFSKVQCIDSAGERLKSGEAERFEAIQDRLRGKEFTLLAAAAENPAISTGNLLFEKSLYAELGGFKAYKYVHDYDFFVRAALVTEPVFVGGTNYLYRLHGENSFTRLAREGVRENRLVWLDLYRKIKQGKVANPAILCHKDYRELFARAVAEYGRKKLALWNMCENPLVRAGAGLIESVYYGKGKHIKK